MDRNHNQLQKSGQMKMPKQTLCADQQLQLFPAIYSMFLFNCRMHFNVSCDKQTKKLTTINNCQ